MSILHKSNDQSDDGRAGDAWEGISDKYTAMQMKLFLTVKVSKFACIGLLLSLIDYFASFDIFLYLY